MNNSKSDQVINNLILKYLKTLCSISYIAKRLNLEPSEVKKRITTMEQSGIKIPHINTPDQKLSFEIFRLIKYGFSVKEIIKELKIEESFILKQIAEMRKNDILLPTMILTESDRFILRHKAQGFSDEDIAKLLQVQNVYKYVTFRLELMQKNGYLIPYDLFQGSEKKQNTSNHTTEQSKQDQEQKTPDAFMPVSIAITRDTSTSSDTIKKRKSKNYDDYYMRIIELLHKNYTHAKIAEALDKSEVFVYTRLAEMKNFGLITSEQTKRKSKQTDYSDDYKRLQPLYEHNCSNDEMARVLGRSISYICSRLTEMRKLGLITSYRHIKSKQDENKYESVYQNIKSLLEKGLSPMEIAVSLRRSTTYVYSRIREMYESGILSYNPLAKTDYGEIYNQIKELINQKKSNVEIALILGKSKAYVDMRISEMKNLGIISRSRRITIDYTDVYKKIQELLQSNTSCNDIAIALGRSRTYVDIRIREMERLEMINTKAVRHYKTQKIDHSELDERIFDLYFTQKKSFNEIATITGYCYTFISNRIHLMIEEKLSEINSETNQNDNSEDPTMPPRLPSELATQEQKLRVLLNLQKTRGASLAQLKKLAIYYDVDPDLLEQALSTDSEVR